MRLHIENIGSLRDADIVIEGITIIAGENNVGKSTIGKSLYAFLNNMDTWREIYEKQCQANLVRYLNSKNIVLEDLSMRLSGAIRRRTNKVMTMTNNFALQEDFVTSIEDYQVAENEKEKEAAVKKLHEFLRQYCQRYIELYLKQKTEGAISSIIKEIEAWISDTISGLGSIELDELVMQKNMINQSFQSVFQKQFRRIKSDRSRISFQDDKNREVYMEWNDDIEKISAPLRVSQQIHFIESPKIYDFLSDVRYGHVQKEYLQYLMAPNVFKKKDLFQVERDSSESLLVLEKTSHEVQEVIDELTNVMGGRAEFFQKVGLEFKDKNIKEPIHAVNVSTGLKSIALLEYALRIGAINSGDILVLDEPEINLHPEWQKEYAQALVLLQKSSNLKLIVTTHSPYFIRSIECFSDLNGVMDCLNVYKIVQTDGNNVVENLSYSEYGMTELYDDLSAPLEELEELLSEKYGVEEE